MEKGHFQNFVKVQTVVFEKCKEETSSKLYSTFIYYLALQHYEVISMTVHVKH